MAEDSTNLNTSNNDFGNNTPPPKPNITLNQPIYENFSFDIKLNKKRKMEDIELYKRAKARVKNTANNKWVTDADIIIEQEKEIQYYREKINKMNVILERNIFACACSGQLKDYEVTNHYADGELVKTEYRYLK